MTAFFADPAVDVILVLIGLAGMFWEAHAPGTFVAGVAGAVLLCFGLWELTENWAVAGGVSLALASIVFFLAVLGWRAQHARVLTGTRDLVGETGTVCRAIEGRGTVFVRGEYWEARSETALPVGARVAVERVQGLVLYVREA